MMIVKICPIGCEPEDDGDGWRVQLFVHSSMDARFIMAHLGKEMALSFPQQSPAEVLSVIESYVVNPEE